jgi:hypothetical protein
MGRRVNLTPKGNTKRAGDKRSALLHLISMDRMLCNDCQAQLKRASERQVKPHAGLKVKEHVGGGKSMLASNTNETTTYACVKCGARFVYCGADKTESRPCR